MSASVQIVIAAEDKASAAMLATAKIYKDNIARSIELNNAAMTAEERHAAAIRQFQTDMVKGLINRETYNRLVEQSIVKHKIETESVRLAREETERATAKNKLEAESLKKTQIEVDRYTRSQQLRTEAMKRQASAGAASGGGGGMASMAGMASRFAPAISIGLLTKQSLELAAGTETAKVAFEVLTGSAEKASSMIQEMKALDAKSPISFIDIQQAGKTLLGYGVTAEKVMPALKQLGDISMGNGDRFKSLSLAFGQVQASGRLMGQEVLQMVNNGFNPLQEISKNTGKSMIVLKKEMEDGKISAQMVTDALASATSQGGRFFGMTERMSSTASGAYAKMVSDLQKVGMEFGDKLLPAAIQFAKYIGVMADRARPLVPIVETMANGWGAIAALLSGNISKYMDEYAERTRTAAFEEKKVTSELTKQVEQKKKLAASTGDQVKANKEKTNLTAFSDERKEFKDRLKAIDEEYRRKMLGEEQFNKMKLLTTLRTNEMVAGEQQQLNDAFEKLEFIKILDANEKKKEEDRKTQESIVKKAEEDAKRVEQIKSSELEKLEEQRILLEKGKQAAHAFNLEKQGLKKEDAERIAQEQAELDKRTKKPVIAKDTPALQAVESRLLTRGSGEDFLAKNTADSANALRELLAIQKAELDEKRRNKNITLKVVGSGI